MARRKVNRQADLALARIILGYIREGTINTRGGVSRTLLLNKVGWYERNGYVSHTRLCMMNRAIRYLREEKLIKYEEHSWRARGTQLGREIAEALLEERLGGAEEA